MLSLINFILVATSLSSWSWIPLTVLGNILHLVHPQKPTFVFLYTHAFFMESVKAPESHLIILPVSDDWHTQPILFVFFIFSWFLCLLYILSFDRLMLQCG
jgi:hypothetical protein